MKNYYLNLNEEYDERKVTIFRTERKKLNREIFPIWFDSWQRTEKVNELFDDVFLPIMLELRKYSSFEVTNMLVFEIFTSLNGHNLMSIFLTFRSLLVAFVLEHKDYSVTKQKSKLGTFSKTLIEVDEIFTSTKHFEYGVFQHKIDWIFENGIKFPEKDISGNWANKKNYKELVKYCNKIAHCEIRFNEMNDDEALMMCKMSEVAISYTIALVANIVRFKIVKQNIKE